MYNFIMFNLQHNLYMIISGWLTIMLLIIVAKCVKKQKAKNTILQIFAIATVVIHYSNLWVDFFATGGTAYIENNHILPVYPCNVLMWMLLIVALLNNKKSVIFHMLAEFCFYAGTISGIVGIVFNINFGHNPTLADYNILKGMLSHSTMIFACIYLLVGRFIKIRVFNALSVTAGLGCFVICGLVVNSLYEAFGMVAPDGMFLYSNPIIPVSPILLGLIAVIFIFGILALWELKLPREERWYVKLFERKK